MDEGKECARVEAKEEIRKMEGREKRGGRKKRNEGMGKRRWMDESRKE